MKDPRSLIVIPARMESKRLPGKPLLRVGGKTLLEWTYQRAAETHPSRTLVATSDEVIKHCCRQTGMKWMDTMEHPTGTHRVAEAVDKLIGEWDIVVNWQVDEPLVKSVDVLRLVKLARKREIGTLVAPLGMKDRRNRDVVKASVRTDQGGVRCTWFGRHHSVSDWGHVGVYAFDREALKLISQYESTEKSKEASLEQLTWLEFDWNIWAEEVEEMPLSINTPEDLEKFKEIVDVEID
jgi:3-deoxy-manno-octulosonate cytidylyltransferase (CMP-KDO synthetase)